MNKNKWMAGLLVAFFCVAAVNALRYWKSAGVAHQHLTKERLTRSRGNPDAGLWVVEHSDYQCPACARAQPVLEEFFERYPGEVFLQARPHPLKSHSFGFKSAAFAECAARQGKFWEMHRVIFERQREWSGAPDPEEFFYRYAAGAGLETRALRRCVEDPAVYDALWEEKKRNWDLGVRSTPTFFVNGKMAVGGTALRQALEDYFRAKESSSDG